MTDVLKLDTELNAIVSEGKMLDALAAYYDENCSFQEGNGEPRQGRQAQHDHLSAFLGTLQGFNGATLHSQGVGGDTSLTEWTFDMVGPEGPIVWNEILRRKWKNGKVISERFYTAD